MTFHSVYCSFHVLLTMSVTLLTVIYPVPSRVLGRHTGMMHLEVWGQTVGWLPQFSPWDHSTYCWAYWSQTVLAIIKGLLLHRILRLYWICMIEVELINDCFLMQSLYLSLVEGNSYMKTVNNMLFGIERIKLNLGRSLGKASRWWDP